MFSVGSIRINPRLGEPGCEKWLIKVILHECIHLATFVDGEVMGHGKSLMCFTYLRRFLDAVFHAYRRKMVKAVGVTIPFAPLPADLVEILRRPLDLFPGWTNDDWILYWKGL